MSSGQHDLLVNMTSGLYDHNKILWGFKVSISSNLQISSLEEFKIQWVYLQSLIWIPLTRSKEKTKLWP